MSKATKPAPIVLVHGIFGFARGEQTPHSDVDLLMELPMGASLLDLLGLNLDLQDTLGRNVDVLAYEGLSPYLRDQILHEARPL